ncbi:hypothetical protein [Legionella sp. CNM-4043-24]|uniref:hypothetical protein n=1 Tax=Legionella sp. CNM-4043-24 TaxID=3421646 RepID=UPI00403B26C6
MRQGYTHPALCLILTLICTPLTASPWFTGPILAPAGHTLPRGHTNLETYGFFTHVTRVFDNNGNTVPVPYTANNTLNPLFTHGLTDRMDLQFSLPMAYNRVNGVRAHHIADTSITLGYQVMEQKESRWRPNLRITLQESIPTGRFEQLIPRNNGADATGIGTWQTELNLNFQHLHQFSEKHYLRTRFSLGYAAASNVNVNGITPYGSGIDADGNLFPGNLYTIDLAGEFTLNQQWVAVMEGYYSNRGATRFAGFPGFKAPGVLAIVGNRMAEQISLAPAIEYNINANVGVIAGFWFALVGKNSADFRSPVVALNAYW